ncbi:hypothetical protein HPB48_014458 [Haemaphysalis longicornis]|uniref:Transmembrane protein n=1 Tax=Haemaphysalis longicornis TaxID=44386 RepID=A0A9J6H3C9_HAELO|nr:hypothetical protein HPB48_014458 [Haemaphysalis longicornis]
MVRVAAPHHVVYPAVCCSVKRVVRLLPSALLLIFVLSLILVTLVQIAVVHSQRRAIYIQRRLSSAPSRTPTAPASLQAAVVAVASGQLQSATSDASGSPTSNFHAWSATHRARESQKKPNASHNRAQSKLRPNALHVEALLDRNAPTVENNIKILTGLANAARIRDIFAGARNVSRTLERSRALFSAAPVRTLGNLRSHSEGDVPQELVSDDVYRRAGSGALAASQDIAQRTPLCPEVPPGLGELFLNHVGVRIANAFLQYSATFLSHCFF